MSTKSIEDLTTHEIVLEAGSSASPHANLDLRTGIQRVAKSLTLLTNESNMMGEFKSLEKWFNPGSIANALSLSRVSSKNRVFIDRTEAEGACTNTDEGYVNFRLNSLGLLAHNARDRISEVRVKNKNKSHASSSLQVVDANSTKRAKEQTRMSNK